MISCIDQIPKEIMLATFDAFLNTTFGILFSIAINLLPIPVKKLTIMTVVKAHINPRGNTSYCVFLRSQFIGICNKSIDKNTNPTIQETPMSIKKSLYLFFSFFSRKRASSRRRGANFFKRGIERGK